MTFCLLLPLTTYASWWNPTTWNSWSFFGWKITREEPQLDKQESKVSAEETSATKLVNTDTPHSATTKKVEINSTSNIKKEALNLKKEVQSAPTNTQRKNNPEPVYENIFTSNGYVKIDLNEYETFRSDDGNKVVYMNKKTGEKVIPKSTQNYDDNMVLQQSIKEKQEYLDRTTEQNKINQMNEINGEYKIKKDKLDKCIADINRIKLDSAVNTSSYGSNVGGVTNSSAQAFNSDVQRKMTVEILNLISSPECSSVSGYIPTYLISQPKTIYCNLDYAGFGGNYTVSCN